MEFFSKKGEPLSKTSFCPSRSKYVIYMIGDQQSDKKNIINLLLQKSQEKNKNSQKTQVNGLNKIYEECLGIYLSKILHRNQIIEVYDFPNQRSMKQSLEIYFNILPKPTLILYFIHLQANQKQLMEWIQLIQSQQFSISFISDVKTYSQRQQIIKKMSKFFRKDILEHIYFINIDKSSFFTCLCNLGSTNTGMSLKNYIRKVNTWSMLKYICLKVLQLTIYRFKKDKSGQSSII